MRLLTIFLLLLLLWSAEPRRGGRSKATERGTRGRVRGRGRARITRRQTQGCVEYMEGGEKFLDCQDRQLTSVMQDWPKDIQHLLLARNKLKVLSNNMFAQFTQLKSLELQHNIISIIEDNAFSGLSQLTTLLLQGNKLITVSEEVLLPMPRLTYLRLFQNPWSCRCPLDSLVRHLQVPSNRNLGNYATCAEPRSLKGRKLKKLDVDLCAEDEDELVSICTSKHSKFLDCSNKELNDVPPGLPSGVVKLNLSKNSITHLRPKQFLLFKDLKLLNLSSNNLQQIDSAAFAGLLHLRELDLSNNSLHYFQYDILEDLYFLRILSLENNPWICDYNIHYLVYWLKHHPDVRHTGLICSEPQEFRSWRVEDYVKTYNGECPVDKQTEGSDTGQGAQESSENDAQEVMGEMGDGQEELLPQHLKEKETNGFEIIRLS